SLTISVRMARSRLDCCSAPRCRSPPPMPCWAWAWWAFALGCAAELQQIDSFKQGKKHGARLVDEIRGGRLSGLRVRGSGRTGHCAGGRELHGDGPGRVWPGDHSQPDRWLGQLGSGQWWGLDGAVVL